MLPCNNNAFGQVWLIICAAQSRAAGRARRRAAIIAAMSDANDVAQRYLALWVQYLTTLLADPRAIETLNRWMAFTDRFAYPPPAGEGHAAAPAPTWPPFFGPFGLPLGAGGAPGGEVAELARRVDELERRLDVLETRLASVVRASRSRRS